MSIKIGCRVRRRRFPAPDRPNVIFVAPFGRGRSGERCRRQAKDSRETSASQGERSKPQGPNSREIPSANGVPRAEGRGSKERIYADFSLVTLLMRGALERDATACPFGRWSTSLCSLM